MSRPICGVWAGLAGETYGVPHWTCGYFLITQHRTVHEAGTATALNEALNGLNTPAADLTGSVVGSHDSLFLYLDAAYDSDPMVDLTTALDSLRPEVLDQLRVVTQNCLETGENRCEEVEWPPVRPKQYAAGKADAFLGYSERLHSILMEMQGEVATNQLSLFVGDSPLGTSKRTALFTDALVRSSECIDTCAETAEKFAEYYVSDATFSQLLMSLDTTATNVPRYLLPSTRGALNAAGVSDDRLYKQLRTAVTGAKPFPSSGMPAHVRTGAAKKKIEAALFAPIE